MLRWALVFFVIALIAGAFGYWGVESQAVWMGKVLCFIFLVLFVVSLLLGRRAPQIE